MPLPVLYRKSSEGAIASYSFTDIAEGTGIVKLYGFAASTNAGNTYQLSENPSYSEMVESDGTLGNIDYNLTAFNLPKIIQGTGVISVCAHVGSGTLAMTFVLQKVVNGSASNIVTVVSSSLAATGTRVFTVPMTIPKTTFKKGDNLRLNVQCNNANLVYGLDPQNRDGASFIKPSVDKSLTTRFEVYIPFKLDL